ncbi:MFS transporter [Massilia sp. JS1662]|nr:MFS transporter [Massilia sp. JS1662]KGF80070.1 MFS transporter [Massilia sp. JS1662]
MQDAPNPRTALLRDRNFKWLMSGGVISTLGDQFTQIALPWLVLKLTGDAVALGMAVALMGIPRAILILFGGALVDRHSPKRILMLTKHVNTVLLAVLAVLVYTGQAHLPVVLALALGLSLASAFSIPAGTSMLPHAVAPQHLQAANGMMMGLRQITMLAGPLLAGLLFALAGDGSGGPEHMRGLALAFGFDCISFALSAWTLAKVQPRPFTPAARQPVLKSVADGLAAVWRDTMMRTCFIYWGLCACVIGGVMQVALPLLASSRLHGASALGLLMGAHGAGALLGMAASGIAGKRRAGNLGMTLLLIDGIAGVLLVPLGMITASWQGMLINIAIGVLGGFVQVAVFTWIQQRVPRELLGRTMSLFMFIFMGLAPLAAVVAGWIASRVTLETLFAGSGLFLVGAALLAWLFTPMRTLRDAPAGTMV